MLCPIAIYIPALFAGDIIGGKGLRKSLHENFDDFINLIPIFGTIWYDKLL
jgi:hypothetical protein